MLKFLGLSFAICLFMIGYARTKNIEDVKKEYADILTECLGEHKLSKEDLDSLAKQKMTDQVKCVFACALKKTGMMDKRGKLSPEGVRKSTEKYLSDDPDLLKRTEQFIDACISVNDAPVSDGERGCDRAVLIFQCTVQKAPTFDLF